MKYAKPTIRRCCLIALLAAMGLSTAGGGELRYRPDGADIIIANGKNHFNRPLYGGRHSAFFVYASDVPEMMLSLPGKGGTLWLGIVAGQKSKWLQEAEHVVARYRAGAMRYEVRDPILGPGMLTIDVVPMAEAEGALVRAVCSKDVPAADLAWSFGGASGYRNNGWDFDTARYCPESAAMFRPDDCANNEFKLTEGGFELRAPCYAERPAIQFNPPGSLGLLQFTPVAQAMRPVVGITPPGSINKIVSAKSIVSPGALWDSSGKELPILAGRCTMTADQPMWFAFEWLDEGAAPIARADLPAAIRAAESRREDVAGQARVSTPDPHLNAAVPALCAAADGLWDSRVYAHGGVAWRMPYLGWRGAYVGSEFGWHDRAKAHFREFAKHQFREPADARPHAAEEYNLSRQAMDSVFYSRGHIPNMPFEGLKGQGNMQAVYIDQLLWHLQWTGDMDFAREMWPVLVEHLAWEKRCFDPDDDGLYENFANTMISDAHHYGGGPCTQASAYHYRACRLAALLAERLGKDPEPFRREAEKTLSAMNRALWMPERGWYAEYRDLLGLKRLHPSAELASVYHPIDSDVPDMFQAHQMLRYVDTSIEHVAIDGSACVLWSSSWVPYLWSTRNVIQGEVAHTALANWQAGRREKAWDLYRGALLDSMYGGRVPGNCVGVSDVDGRWGGAATDFNCTVGMFARALVEGLFGIVPNRIEGEWLVRPGLPPDWDSASIDTPDVGYSYLRTGEIERFEFRAKRRTPARLRLQAAARGAEVAWLKVNGQGAPWKCVASVGEPRIEAAADKSDDVHIEIGWRGERPARAACPEAVGQGEPMVARFDGATVVEIRDPQKVLKGVSFEGGQMRATADGQIGHRTAFIKLAQGDLVWWSPLCFEIRPPLEMLDAKLHETGGQLEFSVRNNTDSALAGPAVVRCGDAKETIDIDAPPRSMSQTIRMPATGLVPGTNPIAIQWASGRKLVGAAGDWRAPAVEHPLAFECVDLAGALNARVSDIFKQEYRSPRSPCCSLQIPLNGYGDWNYCGKGVTPTIDDAALRKASGDAGRLVGPQGIPLATPGPGDAPNVVFTSQWDNYPREATVSLSGRARHAWFLVAGSTHPMHSQLDNGEILIVYADGGAERLPLHNPTNWWPIEGDYDLKNDGFCVPGPRPPRIDLGVGWATLVDLPLDPTRELKEITVRCLANDVVVGLMSATLLRP